MLHILLSKCEWMAEPKSKFSGCVIKREIACKLQMDGWNNGRSRRNQDEGEGPSSIPSFSSAVWAVREIFAQTTFDLSSSILLARSNRSQFPCMPESERWLHDSHSNCSCVSEEQIRKISERRKTHFFKSKQTKRRGKKIAHRHKASEEDDDDGCVLCVLFSALCVDCTLNKSHIEYRREREPAN